MLSTAIEAFMALLTSAGLAYTVLALWSARAFANELRNQRGQRLEAQAFAPDVTLLKPVKGVDEGMYAALSSHCRQIYSGRMQMLFGVGSLDDEAVREVERLRLEFPGIDIQLVECPKRLGSSGKVSSLLQLLPLAKYGFVVVNDSDICVSPRYLERILAGFADPGVGMVTAPYLGRALGRFGRPPGLWARLEALGIATEFLPGVLTARFLEGGLRFGLGSTLAMRREALDRSGGFAPLLESLADDYQLGARIAGAGYRVKLSGEVVETTVPAYTWRGFALHQLRWARSTRDSRRLGYLGLGLTYAVPWALLTVIASGLALWSLSLLSVVLLARVALALSVGVGVLRDGQVLRDLGLLPLRDCWGLLLWLWSYAGDTVVWRGERFHLRAGRLEPIR